MHLLRYCSMVCILLVTFPGVAPGDWERTIRGTPLTWVGSISPVVADLDGDGLKELVILVQGNPYGSASTLVILEADGNPLATTGLGYHCGSARGQVSIGDVDRDGIVEIVALCHSAVGPGSELLFFTPTGVLERSVAVDFALSDDIHGSVVLADLDRNGSTEIIYGGWSGAQPTDGSRLVVMSIDGDDLPGFPVLLEDTSYSEVNTPAVGDLDGEPGFEIAVISHRNNQPSDLTNIRAFRNDGSLLWAQTVPAISYHDPVIGDVDSDPRNEVAFTSASGVHIVDDDGTFLLNQTLGANMTHSNLALADFNGDGDLEVVFGYGYYLYGIEHDGDEVFRFQLEFPSGNPPAVGDVDSDGTLDIVVTLDDEAYVFMPEGPLSGIRLAMNDETAFNSPSITDLGGGEVTAIACSNWPLLDYGTVYAWNLKGAYDPSAMPWPMYQHDPQHTGCLGVRFRHCPTPKWISPPPF